MRVFVNATIVDREPYGLGHYALQLIHHLRSAADLVVATSVPEHFSGVEVVEVPAWVRSSETRFKGKPRYIYLNTLLRGLIKRLRPQVILSPNHEVMFRPPVPQVVIIHDLIAYFYPDLIPGQGFYYRKVLPGLLRGHARRIITVSESTREDLIKEYGIPGEMVIAVHSGAGVEPGFDEPGFPLPERYILYVGSFLPYKNLRALLEAFGILEHEDLHLVIAGPTAGKNRKLSRELLAQVLVKGLSERVAFVGYVPSSQLGTLYRNAELLVLPSLYEGFGFPPLEAMSCGTPVAVSRIPALVETVGDAGLYFDPRSPEDMAKAIGRLLSDRQLREEMVMKGKERVKFFSWERTAVRVYEALCEAVRGRS
ncbi:MAG: glycosyltransferase family 1 protein [candidate division WOR-3 bacterium]